MIRSGVMCDRCRRPFSYAVPRSDNPDQPLCAGCCAHLRAGGGWALGSPPAASAPARVCPPDLLPLRAGVLFGDVPLYPTDADFHMASLDVAHDRSEPAAHWRMEAVRERRLRPGCAFDDATLRAIGERVAARLAKENAS